MSHLLVIGLRVIFVVGESEVWHVLEVIRCDNQNLLDHSLVILPQVTDLYGREPTKLELLSLYPNLGCNHCLGY